MVKKILTQRHKDRKGTQRLLENFLQKVSILNVSTISVWIHVFIIHLITLCVLCVSAFIKFCLFGSGLSRLGYCDSQY